MHPGATIFLDVCVQADFWPGAAWPIVSVEQAANVARAFGLARKWHVRQGGIVCRHDPDGPRAGPGVPLHCASGRAPYERPPRCMPVLPMRVERGDRDAATGTLDRGAAIYVDSGCAQRPDAAPRHARAFDHLIAGVRDAVVFGAGVEHGMTLAVEALLARRIRTHVLLDAAGVADEIHGQTIVAAWKRRGVDGTTVEMADRLLEAG